MMGLDSKIKPKGKYDVIVVGGGPSGTPAAIAAARAGAKVLVIEAQNALGGMWAGGYMNPLFDGQNKKGIMAELISNLKAHNAWGGFWGISFNFEYMKTLLEQKCRDAGVAVLYDTHYIGVETVDNKVVGVYASNIEGLLYFEADVVIDASGDAKVAADAGAQWQIGEDGDYSKCQSMTLMFMVSGIPEKYRDGLMLREVAEAAFEKEGKGHELPFKVPYLIPAPNADFANVQLTHMRGYDPLDAADRTKAVMEGRRQMMEVFEALKNYDEDFKELSLVQSAPLLGVRESRRIVGEYTLNEQDLINGAKFPDGVCTCSFNIDIHNAQSTEQSCQKVQPYQIPFRCLIPKGVEGLLVAGRTISGTHIAMASYRVTGNCCAMGEAAGKAAAYAAAHKVSVRAVPDSVVAEINID
ncbi:MAG: FAD-dependent oxidoreductase [Clostridia bacterium]|nr:FAD-dependent oxidoreductase [Clostridia bacterium]